MLGQIVAFMRKELAILVRDPGGLALLFVVRFQYVLFLWPLALLAVFMVITGIFQAHAVMRAIRETFAASHPVRRFVMVQEMAFWMVVCGGVYGVYFVLTYSR